jgi:hypothetical protein
MIVQIHHPGYVEEKLMHQYRLDRVPQVGESVTITDRKDEPTYNDLPDISGTVKTVVTFIEGDRLEPRVTYRVVLR